jgi:hypothetical protein
LGSSCIFVEREKREGRGRALRREIAFAGGENVSQGITIGMYYEATNNNKEQSIQYRFEGLYSH